MAAWSPTWVTYSAENQKGKEFMGMGSVIQHSVSVLRFKLSPLRQHWLEYQQHLSFSKLGQVKTTDRNFFF